MKTIHKSSKIGCLLISLALFQSCVVYDKAPVTIEQAVQENTKTRIILKDGRIEKFKFITYQEPNYYGTRLTGKGYVNIPIDPNAVSEIHVKNKTTSTVITATPLIALATIMTVAILGWQ